MRVPADTRSRRHAQLGLDARQPPRKTVAQPGLNLMHAVEILSLLEQGLGIGDWGLVQRLTGPLGPVFADAQ
jgi:hypothetical protein